MPGDTVTVVDRNNNAIEVTTEQAGELLARGDYRLETGADVAARAAAEVEEDLYGGAAGAVVATGAGIARGITGGLSDAALAAAGADTQLRKLRRQNEVVSTGSEILGAVLPIGAGGLAARAGATVARTAEGAGAVARIGRAGAGAAVEGGIAGIGSGISELALSEDPVTLERAASVLSSNALFGAGIGGAAGSLGKTAEIGLRKAKAGLDGVRQRVADGGGELAGKSAAEIDELAEAEVSRLVTEQSAAKVTAVDDLVAYRKAAREANPYLVADDKTSAMLSKSDRSLERALDTPDYLRSHPGQLARTLETQEQAILKTIGRREELLAAFEKQNQKIAKEVADQLATDAAEIELSGKAMRRYASFADVKVSRKTPSIKLARSDAEQFAAAIESGAVKGAAEQSLGKLDAILEANRALRDKIKSTQIPKSELVSERLAMLRDAKKAAEEAANRPRGFVEDMAQGSIFGYAAGTLSGVPILGPLVGAKVARAATDLVFGRLGKAATEAAARTSRGIDAFLDVAQRPLKAAPVIATKTLSRVRYAQQTEREAEAEGTRKSLASLYRARSAEIRSQTEYGPDGRAVMRPEARQALASQLAGARAANPLAADRLETIAARRLEFLANKLPRRPDIGGVPMGPDNWQPSDLEMRAFARYAAAVEDPAAIVDRLAAGTITPEDAEAMREVYPETMAEIQARIVEKLPELRKTLPYNRRVALSIFSGVPVDPAMRPEILAVLQGQFTEEPGTEGGEHPPTAAPQFGSVKSPDPTPAQTRAG